MTNIEPEDLKEALDVLATAAEDESTEELAALDGASEEELASEIVEEMDELVLSARDRQERTSFSENTDTESFNDTTVFSGAAETAVAEDEGTEDLTAFGGVLAADPENTSVEDAEIAVLNDTAEAGPAPEETPEEEAQELAALDSADEDEIGTDAVDADMEDAADGAVSAGETEHVLNGPKRQNIYGDAAQNDNRARDSAEEGITAGTDGPEAETAAAGATAPEAAGDGKPSAPKTALLVSVGFRNAGKKLYYRTGGYDLHIGDRVIVETVRGMEMGSVVMPPMEMDLKKLRIDPGAIVRPANEVDMNQEAENRAREREAYHVCKQKIGEHGLDMKLVQAEYTFDRNKLIFYFTADGRVDFRQLLKDLASTFHTRIELRQIGVRDETRVLGGIGVCGREVCCKTYLRTFAPVSVKMAKEQNLSLNPTKISGLCGRLMCCLKNEEETYEYLNRAMPRLGSKVQTKEGETGVVKNIDILKQKASVLFEENDEREMRVYNVSDLVFRSYRGKREEGMEIPPANAGEEGIRPADGDVEIDISVESELPASESEDGNHGGDRRNGDRRGRRNDRSDRGDRRGGGRRNYKGDRDGASGEGSSSEGSREGGSRNRRNNNENKRSGGYRKGGNGDGESSGRANGGYDRGYRRDSAEGAESEGGRANGGYDRGYGSDFHRDGDGNSRNGGDRRHGNGNRNRRNDGRKFSKNDGGGRRDGSDAQGNRENRRPAEEQS